MKVILMINVPDNRYLTTGKIYDVIDNVWLTDESGVIAYKIKDDSGRTSSYRSDMFIELSEWRRQKLNEIFDV